MQGLSSAHDFRLGPPSQLVVICTVEVNLYSTEPCLSGLDTQAPPIDGRRDTSSRLSGRECRAVSIPSRIWHEGL